MKNLFKRLFGESIIYGLSGIISSFISIFLIPLYTKVFIPADYGIISLLFTTNALLSILIIFSLDNAAAVWFWDKTEEKERKITFTSWVGFLAIGGLAIGILLSLSSVLLSKLYFNTPAHYFLFILIGINLCFLGFQKAANIWCRMLQKPFMALGYSISLLLVTVGCNILFILYLKVGIVGVFYSQLISSILGFLLLMIVFRKWIVPGLFNKIRLKEMLRFAAPLVPATLMFWLMNTASVFFIKIFIKDNAEIGLFQLGASVANVLALFTWGFFQAWSPFALSISKQDNAKKVYSLILEGYCVLGFLVAFSLFLMSDWILLTFTNQKYIDAKDVIGLLAINVILQGIPNILAIGNYLAKNNNSYAIAIGIGAVISVLGFIIFIPWLGKEGAAVAMIAGNLAVPVFLGFRVQKIYYVPYRFERIIGFVVLQGIIFFLAKFFLKGFFLHLLAILLLAAIIFFTYLHIAKRAGIVSSFSLLRRRN